MRRKAISKDLRRMCIIAHRIDEVIFRAAFFVQGPKYMLQGLSRDIDVYFNFTWNIKFKDSTLGKKIFDKYFLIINIKFIINLLILLYWILYSTKLDGQMGQR